LPLVLVSVIIDNSHCVSVLQMAKEDALTQLHVEKRLRANAEERSDELNRKLAELETQLHALQTAGHVQVRICLIICSSSVV